MKIGVVTFWFGDDNYGMIMQCWALQRYLKSLGHEPFVVKYHPTGNAIKRLAKLLISTFKDIRQGHSRDDKALKKYNLEQNKLRDFRTFRQKQLVFSKMSYHYIEKLRRFPPVADCYICGSDQIWKAPLRFANSLGYFLGFGKPDVLRIAYAPSFGMEEYPQNDLPLLRNALSKFDAISCREFAGVNFCKKVGYDATKVEDPTLLLDKDDYSELLSCSVKGDYVFIYSLNIVSPEDIYWPELKQMVGYKEVIVTPASGYTPSKELFGREVTYKYATPGEWLSLINDANMVVTSSFHGVVFAILFNTRFAYVPLKGKYASANNRIYDLLKSLNLEFAIVRDGKDYERLMDKEYQWNKVNRAKEELLTNSKAFLDKALSKK